jgi:hypothetical protein
MVLVLLGRSKANARQYTRARAGRSGFTLCTTFACRDMHAMTCLAQWACSSGVSSRYMLQLTK